MLQHLFSSWTIADDANLARGIVLLGFVMAAFGFAVHFVQRRKGGEH